MTTNNSKTLSEILASAPKNAKQTKETIYKISLGKTQEERKKARTKIRRIRDKFINAFLDSAKGEREKLAKDWLAYASEIYKDTKIICESNTNEDTKDLINQFLVELAKVTNK